MNPRYDVVVIGGGAAGLNDALMLARSRRSEVRDRPIGVLATGPTVTHQAGRPYRPDHPLPRPAPLGRGAR